MKALIIWIAMLAAFACAALTAAQVLTQTVSNELITNAGWECVPGARVVDGNLVITFAEGIGGLNDSVLRLQTGRDVAISVTVETELGPGFAGLNFWNSQPPPGDSSSWYRTAARLSLGISGRRPYTAIFDGTGSTPAFLYTGPQPVQGQVTLSATREGDAVVIRIAGAEVARIEVIGPLTGGPLFLGPGVNKGKTLTVHRITVTDGAHPNGAEIVRALAPAAPAGAGMTLRTAAAARNRLIGTAINQRSLRWSQPARDIAAREFNLLTGGDMFTFRVLHPARDQYQFCGADQLVAFAEANNMRVYGGPGLLWGQNPAWLTDGTFSRDELIAIMRDHIQTVVGRYRGRVHIWNVANEIFEYNNTGQLAKGDQQIWMRIIGPEYIDMAFRWAHEADPQAILVLNEVNDEGTKCAARCGPGNPNGSRNVKADALVSFVKGMRARGIPINAVGMQTHWGAWMNFHHPAVDPSSVAAQMKRLADLGLDVYITEMDVAIQKPVTPAKLAAQAETYRQMMSTCLAAANCKGFTVFGTYDSLYSEPPFLARTGSDQQGQWAAAVLFDEAFRPKPAYDALAAALRAR
jgi:endo-1,4-beta-xylanase